MLQQLSGCSVMTWPCITAVTKCVARRGISISNKCKECHACQAGRYALTGQARRSQEAVAAAVQLQEPVLLVGETGSGKTSLLQQLATQVCPAMTAHTWHSCTCALLWCKDACCMLSW